MKRIAALIICLQLFVTSSYAGAYNGIDRSCLPTDTNSTPTLTVAEQQSVDICSAALAEYGFPQEISTEFKVSEILPIIGGCLTGGGQAVMDELGAIKFLAELLLKDLPSYLWDRVTSIFDDEEDINPIAAVDKASEANESVIEKAHRMAVEYYKIFEKFLNQVWEMAKTEYQSFFCLPKPEQARILCRMVSNGFLLVFSPTQFIKGAKWTTKSAQGVKKLFAAAMQATRTTAKLTQRLDDAASILIKSAEKSRMITKLDEEVEIISKQVGDETVYYLQTLHKGEKITRELVLDQHSKMFSINGQGKKVIDMLIEQGVKNGDGAAILLDVNNLGKVNYFSKGLTSGDEYISTVSDVIRESIEGMPGVRAFRTGGDELTLFSNGLSRDEVFKLSKKINDDVLADPRVQKIFIDEKAHIARQLADAKAAGDANAIAELTKGQAELLKMDGSITVGSRMFQKGDDYSSIQTVINDALSPAKATYKKEIGMPFEKYGKTLDNVKIEKIDGKVAPPVLPPR